jgi:opacity protein-like surface antigen
MKINNAKKALISGLAGLALLVSTSKPLSAAVIGGAETVGKGKIAVSASGEYIADREMNDSSMAWRDSINMDGGSLEFNGNAELKTEINQMDREMLKVTYGLLERLDLYGIVGMAGGKAEQTMSGLLDWSGFGETGKANIEGKADINFKRNFAYGAGIRGVINLPKEFLLGADFQWIFHKNNYSGNATVTYTESTSGETASTSGSFSGKAKFTEPQGSVYLAKRIGHFVPYAGGKYNKLNVKSKADEGETEKFKSNDNFGPVVGLGVNIGEHFSIALEGSKIGKAKQVGLEGRVSF